VNLFMEEKPRQKVKHTQMDKKYEEDTHGLMKQEHPKPPLDRMRSIVEDVDQKRAEKSKRE
jgi:hypothetical protein